MDTNYCYAYSQDLHRGLLLCRSEGLARLGFARPKYAKMAQISLQYNERKIRGIAFYEALYFSENVWQIFDNKVIARGGRDKKIETQPNVASLLFDIKPYRLLLLVLLCFQLHLRLRFQPRLSRLRLFQLQVQLLNLTCAW